MRPESLSFLQSLLSVPSPSGFEMRGQSAWLRYVKAFADHVETDAYGNAYAVLNKGGSPRIMLTGHADEIGFMVTHIDERGFLYMSAIGGIDGALLRGKRLSIHGHGGPVRGVIGATAIHLVDREKNSKAPKVHECFVDIGASSREDALAQVAVGDAATFVDDFELLSEQVAVARAFDNRVGTFAAAEAMRLLSEARDGLNAEVWAVSTVQEELGANGAAMVAHTCAPDVCLAIDVTHATDSPGISKEQHGDVKLGGGPTICFGAANHPVLVGRLLDVAQKADIKVQREATPGRTGTDLDRIFIQRGGIVGACLGIPNRYMHTAVEMIRLDDLEATARLLHAFCRDVAAGERFRVPIDL